MLFQLLSTFLTKGLSLVAARAMHNNMLKNLLRQALLLWKNSIPPNALAIAGIRGGLVLKTAFTGVHVVSAVCFFNDHNGTITPWLTMLHRSVLA